MTRHVPNEGTGFSYEEGVPLDLIVNEMKLEDGTYGPSILFKFGAHNGQDELWVWASTKLGKHQGRVSKLRGICNAIFRKPENTEILWFDDETFEVAYEGGVEKLHEGATLRGRGEYVEGKDGNMDKFTLTRFASVSEKREPVGASKAHTSGDVRAEDIPF